MKTRRLFFKPTLAAILCFSLASCSDSNKSSGSATAETKLSLQVVDSILVDYMEELTIMDASKDFEEFLALNRKTDEIVMFNYEGAITNSFENQRNSPEGINDIVSISFMDDKEILIGARPLKLALYDKHGKQKKVFNTSSLVPRGSSVIQKQIFETRDNKILGHLNAYPESAFSNGLIKPTLMLIDPEKNAEPEPLLQVPSTSKYSDGQFHGYVFPIINYSGKELLLAYSNDPKLYSYNYSDEGLTLNQTVNLEITDFLEIHPSPNEKSYNFDKNHREMKPGMIWRILSSDENIFIIYAKGISDDKFESKIHDRLTKQAIESNPLYLMLLNKDLEILQKDISIPFYILGGLTCVSNDGTFVGRKSPVFSATEANDEIFYTFKLMEDQ